jgi:hypothetical protein
MQRNLNANKIFATLKQFNVCGLWLASTFVGLVVFIYNLIAFSFSDAIKWGIVFTITSFLGAVGLYGLVGIMLYLYIVMRNLYNKWIKGE